MALHEQPTGKTDEWYTPPFIFDALAISFDLDVASPGPAVVPWIPAARHISASSLSEEWSGCVWMNAPFGGRNGLTPWLQKFVAHSNGIALVPDRTSAPWWQWVARHSSRLLFVTPKIRFIGADGQPGRSPAQGTTLISIGIRGDTALAWAARNGLGFLAREA